MNADINARLGRLLLYKYIYTHTNTWEKEIEVEAFPPRRAEANVSKRAIPDWPLWEGYQVRLDRSCRSNDPSWHRNNKIEDTDPQHGLTIWFLTFLYQRSESVFHRQALGYYSTAVSVVWQHHTVSLRLGCKADSWPPFLTPYCSRQASISSAAWTHFSVVMPKISASSPIRFWSNGWARKQVFRDY